MGRNFSCLRDFNCYGTYILPESSPTQVSGALTVMGLNFSRVLSHPVMVCIFFPNPLSPREGNPFPNPLSPREDQEIEDHKEALMITEKEPEWTHDVSWG